MIKLQIVGNLGKDCIVNQVNGKSVMNFSVAHTEKFKDSQGNPKEQTTWVECAYWSDKTTVAEYLKKGKLVYVEGAPSVDAYTNKDGQAAGTLRLRVSSLQLLGGNDANSNNVNQYNRNDVTHVGSTPKPAMTSTEPSNAPAASEGSDDLPF